jgi:hypothetical protein
MGSGEVGRPNPVAVGSADARATAALELLLAATIGGTALRRNALRSFAGKALLAAIHIGVSASSDTGSKIFTTCTEAFGWHSVCQWPMLSDVPGLNGCRYWRFASAWPIWFACPVCARSQRHLRYEYHRHQSNRSTHHRRRHHRRLHPAAVGSLLQILIARIRKENAHTALLLRSTGRPVYAGVVGLRLIPSPGRSA